MATVTLAQCWYFVEDVLRLDAGFDRWHRLSFFIHPILLIVCPLINLARFVGRWLLFIILLPFRTVGGAIVLVGRGANTFADHCRSFIVFVSEFYEVPSRASDAQIGGYILLPFSSGLRVLVLAKEEEDDDEDDDDYEDCLPLLEGGGDEQATKTLFLLEDVSPVLQQQQAEDLALETTTLTKEKKDPKAATETSLLSTFSFRFDRNVPVIDREDYEEENPQMQPSKQEDGTEEDDEYYATYVPSPTTFSPRTATAPLESQSRGFQDKVTHATDWFNISVDTTTEADQEEANYSPRIVAEAAHESRRRRREVEEIDQFHGSRLSQRSDRKAAAESLHRKRREVEEADRSIPEAVHELGHTKRREAEEVDRFYGSRQRSVQEVTQERHDHGNRREVEEGNRFYASYAEKVAWFDQLNAERRSIVSAVWNITLGSASLQKSIDHLELSYRGPAHRKLAKCLESDFEVVYVGQTCLCWEALHYQYRKVEDIILFQDPSLTSFDITIAGRFQQFRILVERFIEHEKFCGERLWNYADSRFSTRTLLQVPEVLAYTTRGQRDEVVTANKLLDAIESAIRTFWSFIRTDDKKPPTPRILPWTSCPVEDPRDLNLWSQIKNETHKKKVKLKELLKNRKVMTSSCDELHIEMLIPVINLQLVLRVLKMSVITTRQLRFCQEKLNSIRFNQGSLAGSTTCCLFPYA